MNEEEDESEEEVKPATSWKDEEPVSQHLHFRKLTRDSGTI